jgi:UDPglucose--hexose-1-phosphate uridylyltransferase
MEMTELAKHSHRRFNPLVREWVLVSPNRTERPWQGKLERDAAPVAPSYDPSCYLCPGNVRAGGRRNPKYESTFVFDNDFAALHEGVPQASLDRGGLLVARTESGRCRVVCYSPDHSLTLARMNADRIAPVVETWNEQTQDLLRQPDISYVQVFENRGEMMGCSNPHPHCQIWASQTLPNEIAKEDESLRNYASHRGSCLLCDYLALERRLGERIVCENESFTVLVPFWAIWPFEVLMIPHRHVAGFPQLCAAERMDLARALKSIGIRYDNLFSTFFPYSMGFHQSPGGAAGSEAWHLHAHYYPPLLRSSSVRKFMVGYEMLATPQRDITPETAAARLRQCSEIHWLDGPDANGSPTLD